MAQDSGQPQGVDLDRTDRLPILDGTLVDDDVRDDAVPLDFSAATPSIRSEIPRPSPVDLPSLAESLRSVEERITRQNTEYEALSQSYEKVRNAEVQADARAHTLARDLAGLRVLLAERDANVAQGLHALGERDAQLNALQREHAKIVPLLDERSRLGMQLEADLRAARARLESMSVELQGAQHSVETLTGQLNAGQQEINSTRRDLNTMTVQAAAYLEHLQIREWRLGFDLNQFRELDAKVGAAQEYRGFLQSERDRLHQRVIEVESKLAMRDNAIAKLIGTAADNEALRVKYEQKLRHAEDECANFGLKVAALESELSRMNGELAIREGAVDDAQAGRTSDAQRSQELLAAADKAHAELTAQHTELTAQHTELTAQMARRVSESNDTEVKRLSDELATKALELGQLNEDNRALSAAMERARAALEEREFLIRRMERSESNHADVLGQIQTSIERLGSPGGAAAAATGAAPAQVPMECTGELVRVDGEHRTVHKLARRTRIGRASGCDLQIESSSVSRHHVLLLLGSRDVVAEDLNSTNGLFVNGHKVSRQLLNDGDLLTIGEAQFRLSLKLAPREPEAPSSSPR